MVPVSLRPALLPGLGALLAAAAAAALGAAAADAAVPVALVGWPNEEQRVPVAEVLAALAAVAGAHLLAPRFWEWERLGGARTRVRAGAIALAGMALPVLPALSLVPLAPPGVNAWLMPVNVATASALVYLLAPALGPLTGGAAAVAAVFAGAAACNVVRGLGPYSPYAYAGGDGWTPPEAPLWWAVPVLLAAAAVAAHTATAGAGRWSRSRTHGDG